MWLVEMDTMDVRRQPVVVGKGVLSTGLHMVSDGLWRGTMMFTQIYLLFAWKALWFTTNLESRCEGDGGGGSHYLLGRGNGQPISNKCDHNKCANELANGRPWLHPIT